MAKRNARPGRTLVIFFVVVGALYALAAFADSWKPRLGLDLAGGTTITLVPVGNSSHDQLERAADIIRQRVNGNGVTEAVVSTSGSQVVVAVPGKLSQSLVDSVARQAQMRFRVLAMCEKNPCVASGLPQKPKPSPSASPSAKSTAKPSATATPKSSPTAKANHRPAFGATAKPSPFPSSLPLVQNGSGNGTGSDNTQTSPSTQAILTWAKSPAQVWQLMFYAAKCNEKSPGIALVPALTNTLATTPSLTQNQLVKLLSDKKQLNLVNPIDDPNRPLIACDAAGNKYLLSPAAIEGKDLTGASAGIGSNSVAWQVNLSFNGHGADIFGDLSRAMVTGGTYAGMQFAIVLDGTLLSAPTFNGVITGGQAQITGNFTQDGATTLANSLKFGSLPVKFESNPTVNAVGPSLAGSQLSAGIIAGVAGLLVVMIYCLFYYRGLGLVVVASLVIATAVTYVIVLLLGKTAGFTLSLPGIAGLIVAVGITADSFIVYFERIRDEMREGKSMRLAVQAGWLRARNTCLAADAVSLLAAVSLYLFAIDVIRGFAFALGISTLIDLAVFFWFTHPVIGLLSRRKFFNSGHRLSGLSTQTLGIDGPVARKVGA